LLLLLLLLLMLLLFGLHACKGSLDAPVCSLNPVIFVPGQMATHIFNYALAWPPIPAAQHRHRCSSGCCG
jgi:hypothetical protein